MQKKIFFDANIVIDLINAGNDLNYPVSWMFSELANRRDILLCSPISFAITYYFLGKKIRDKKVLNEKIRKVFSYFFFTQENAVTMEKVMYSFFYRFGRCYPILFSFGCKSRCNHHQKPL